MESLRSALPSQGAFLLRREGSLLTSRYRMISGLTLGPLFWGHPSILTPIYRAKVAPAFTHAGTAFLGSLWAAAGAICHLRVCQHPRAETEPGTVAQPTLCWARSHVPWAAHPAHPPFPITSPLWKCLVLNVSALICLFHVIDTPRNWKYQGERFKKYMMV